MSLRRILLAGMLVALAACAVLGMIAAVLQRSGDAVGMLFAAIAVAIGFGLMLPLTFLVDRPRYQSGGIAGIIVIAMLMCEILALAVIDIFRIYGRTDDAVGMMLGMTLLAGIPATLGLMLVQFKWARIAAWAFTCVAALTLLITMAAGLAMIIEASWRTSENIFVCALTTLGLGFVISLLLVNVGCGDKRFFRFPAIACALLALVIAIVCLLTEAGGRSVGAAVCTVIAVPAFFAHLNILLMARLRAFQSLLSLLTAAASAACGLTLILAILTDERLLFGFSVASAIASLCGTMAILVLSFFNRRINELPPVESLLKELALTCPRCAKPQSLPTGGASCSGCGLELHIRIVEPRCEKCGYLLYGTGLTQCPECGNPLPTPLGTPAPAVYDPGRTAFPVTPAAPGVSTPA